MPTFARGTHGQLPARHIAYRERRTEAQNTATSDTTTSTTTSRFEFPDPVDLRGIPAIGLGVHGHMAGTQPERHATR